jgi:hypothetical protein
MRSSPVQACTGSSVQQAVVTSTPADHDPLDVAEIRRDSKGNQLDDVEGGVMSPLMCRQR